MNRRDWLRVAGALVLVPRQQQPAARSNDTSAADPLYRPDAVQQRAVVTPLDNDPVVVGIEHRIRCTCGCNLDVYTCRTTDFTCTYSPALHREVVDLRQAGRSAEDVVTTFVAKYGEQILMAPPPLGFNLAGYLLPGSLVALASAALAFVLIRRSRRMAPEPAPVSSQVRPIGNAANDERLRRALEEIDD